jgi:hypothetical protein
MLQKELRAFSAELVLDGRRMLCSDDLDVVGREHDEDASGKPCSYFLVVLMNLLMHECGASPSAPNSSPWKVLTCLLFHLI